MRAVRTLLLILLIGLPITPALAQAPERYSSNEILDTGHRFFGGVSRGLAQVVERAFSTWGQPNGYILGQEGGGAIIGGLRYGEGARTMMLVYSLPATKAIYQRFAGVDGSAYLVGGVGMTALTSGNIVVVPIRSGIGLRLGANIGYLKYTPRATWNPF